MAEHLTDPAVMRFIGVGGARPSRPEGLRRKRRAEVARPLAGETASATSRSSGRRTGASSGAPGLLVLGPRRHPGSRPTCVQAEEATEVELGWTLAREHWGHGYATEAAAGIRDWAYGELGIERLISIIHPENTASEAVARRLGAVPDEEIETTHGPAVVWAHPR